MSYIPVLDPLNIGTVVYGTGIAPTVMEQYSQTRSHKYFKFLKNIFGAQVFLSTLRDYGDPSFISRIRT